MTKYLSKKYGLNDKASKSLLKSIMTNVCVDLFFMIPIAVVLIFIKDTLNNYFSMNTHTDVSYNKYYVYIFIGFIIMYIVARINYKQCFIKVFEESSILRINLANKLKKLPLSYFSQRDIADLSSTIMSDVSAFEKLFSHSIPQVYSGIITVIIISIVMFMIDVRLSISLFWVIPVAFIMFKVSKQKNQTIFREGFELNRSIIDDFQEGIDLAQEIKSYNMEEEFIYKINKKYDDENNYKRKMEILVSSFLNISYILLKLGMSTVSIYGAYLYFDGELELFTYLAFIIMSGFIFNPLITTFSDMTMILYLDSVVKRIKEINNLSTQEGKIEFYHNGYDIVFDNVSFSYENGKDVLNKISFTAKQGEVTALVGPSGSGKTTATKLAARFWDIESGKITIGGTDISAIKPERLLQEFSIVFQDVLLFNSTIMENIRLGKKGASDLEVIKAAKIARCHDFIEKLPNGYHTLIGENGVKLSGGQRQRLSIARALLKDAPIILLDESTASLDAENESKVQEGISALIKNKTVIIIAHRMRTVIDADNIVVLKDGKVVESGTSIDLLKKDGVFARMYNAQFDNN